MSHKMRVAATSQVVEVGVILLIVARVFLLTSEEPEIHRVIIRHHAAFGSDCARQHRDEELQEELVK